jgi:molecular chaperone GrpE
MADKEDAQFQVEDRRFWVQDEAALEQAEVPEKKYPSFVEELKSRTEAAERRLKERLKEIDEENEAFRERLTKETDKRVEREKQALLLGFLDVVDNLERALQAGVDPASLKTGIRLNLDLFLYKLKSSGVEPIDPVNQPFDPQEAEAVGVVPVERVTLDHLVVEVVQKGYRLGDQLIRPARVRVGRYFAR